MLVEIERHGDTSDEDRSAAVLVARAQAGDKIAFAEIYIRYFERVRRYLEIALRNSHDSEDAAQETFAKVLQALPRYEQRAEPFRAWLFKLARNHAFDFQRRRGQTQSTEPSCVAHAGNGAPARAFDDAGEESAHDLRALTSQLPRTQQHVLALRYVYDLSAGDVGELLGMTADGVRHAQMRALRSLARELGVARTPRTP